MANGHLRYIYYGIQKYNWHGPMNSGLEVPRVSWNSGWLVRFDKACSSRPCLKILEGTTQEGVLGVFMALLNVPITL